MSGPRETRAAEATTIAWMLMVTTTLLCASGAAVVWLFARGHADAKQAMVLVRLLHFSSIITAAMSLVLLPIVLKIRQEAPPPSITAFAVIVAVLPILAAFF
ncbi:MAG: hypothetical protein HY288_00285 [Planctomycetia bacterium]|nr:hypothetical protein [Planctomycetia bacterium]